MNDHQSHYLKIWNIAFSAFLGWSEEETAKWAEPLIVRMDRPNLVINESPMFYVARELVWRQSYCDQLSQAKRDRLIEAVEMVMKEGGIGWDFRPGFNFPDAKRQIERLLASPRSEPVDE
jgi:hypothetical protein